MSEVNITSNPSPEGELILGKFKSNDELAAAYKALESKLGANFAQTPEEQAAASSTPPVTPEGTDTPPAAPPASTEDTAVYGEALVSAVSGVGLNIDEVSKEFYSETGLSADTRTKLDQAFGKAAVDAYFAGLGVQNAEVSDAVTKMSQEVVATVGGEEAWGTIAEWAGGVNGDPQLADAFNAAFDRGDAVTAKVIAESIKARYEAVNGSLVVKSVVTGQPAGVPGAAGFRSQQEVTAAMRDPRYGTDPAYREEVARRMAVTQGFAYS